MKNKHTGLQKTNNDYICRLLLKNKQILWSRWALNSIKHNYSREVPMWIKYISFTVATLIWHM